MSIQKEYIAMWQNDPDQEKFRKEFVEKQTKEWKELQKKRKQQILSLEREIKQQEQNIKEQQELEFKEKTEQRRNEIQENLKLLQQRQEEKKKQYEEANQRYLAVKNAKTLAQRFEEQYRSLIEQMEDERNNALKEKKELYRPLDSVALNEHYKKCEENRAKQEEERKQKLEQKVKEWNQFRVQYFSTNYRKVQEDMKQPKNPYDDILKKALEKKEKFKEYQLKVKKYHLPKIDAGMQERLNESIEKLKHQSDFQEFKELAQKVKEKRRYEGVKKIKADNRMKLKPLDSLPQPPSPKQGNILVMEDKGKSKNKNRENSSSAYPSKNILELYLSDQRNILQSENSKQIQSAQELPQLKNYLKEMREKKIFKSKDLLHDWEKYQEDNNDQLLQEVYKIEKEANRQEQLLRTKAILNEHVIKQEDLVDNLIVNSIKAKLKVLGSDIKKGSSYQ